MADEPERRPESDADSEAAEDDAGRDEPESAGSGPSDESDAPRDGGDAENQSDATDGNLSKGAEDDSHDLGPSDGDQLVDADLPHGPEPPTPDEAAAAREADGVPKGAPEGRAGPEKPEPDAEPASDADPEPVSHEPDDGITSGPGVEDEPSAAGEPGEPDGGAVSVDRPDNMAEATAVERKTGPASDQEMPLADHIEEMVTRLFVVIAIAGLVSVAVFPFGEEIIDFLWYSVLPGGDITQPRVYHPLSLILTQLKVASLAGLIVALPVFVYETYAFMRPGLYPRERRYYLASVPMSLVLALVGVTFAYFVVLPAIFTYFLYYTDTVVTVAFALSDTFNLILLLMGYLALVFQIPLFIMLAIMMGLTTRQWLQDRRLYFWGGFLGVAFLFSPDPTGMAPILVGATMITLFEGTLLLLRWTGR